ncbi:MAG: crossover junction endodeoxyribonuclease RuvC [Magnetococcales bacterium]|nr:crossover junction endodeoxyribonuclease RuvC [Magnetococcales bacterium]
MRVLGIDPGSTVTGWGVVESIGSGYRHVAHGAIRTSSDEPMPERLGRIFTGLSAVMQEHRPDAVCVEEIFVSMNVQSALKLGHARGAALVAAQAAGLPVFEYTALQVKQAVVGYGRAEKQQVQSMVKMLLGLSVVPPQDAADALAGALCHLQRSSGVAALLAARRCG